MISSIPPDGWLFPGRFQAVAWLIACGVVMGHLHPQTEAFKGLGSRWSCSINEQGRIQPAICKVASWGRNQQQSGYVAEKRRNWNQSINEWGTGGQHIFEFATWRFVDVPSFGLHLTWSTWECWETQGFTIFHRSFPGAVQHIPICFLFHRKLWNRVHSMFFNGSFPLDAIDQ